MKLFITFAALALTLVHGDSQNYVVPSTNTRSVTRSKPIGIVRSFMNSPGSPGYERTFGYSFESENGIKQEASGEMKKVGDADVYVMKGSYEYIGDDGLTYVVDWYADETGYHASAPHLPKPVEIPFPEQAAAVEAQIRFAQQQPQPVVQASAPAAPLEIIEVRNANTFNAQRPRYQVRYL